MTKSQVVSKPDLTQLVIPEKQKEIKVSDAQIFQALSYKERVLVDQNEGACAGDYVRIRVVNSLGTEKTIQIELGKKFFKEYQASLMGCKVGDCLQAVVNGENIQMEVLSVRSVKVPEMTDELIQRQGIEGVHTLRDYRISYIKENGQAMMERIFRAIQANLIDDLLEKTEFMLEKEEVDAFHQRQCGMLEKISGSLEERLMKGYGDDGKRTFEECFQLFYEDNKRSFSLYVVGKALAVEDQVSPSEEEYAQAMQYYTMIFEKSAQQVEEEGLQEEVVLSFYMQYAIKKLKDYYMSQVTFSA